jgi:hypothetical protein
MMLAHHFVHLIETHSDASASNFSTKSNSGGSTRACCNVRASEHSRFTNTWGAGCCGRSMWILSAAVARAALAATTSRYV